MTEAAVLTVDLGNTSGSLALVHADRRLVRLAAWSAADEDECIRGAVHELRQGWGGPRRTLLSAVGSLEHEERVVALLRELELEVVAHPDPGLEFRIDHPETCGSDRKFAARGALDLHGGSAHRGDGILVVDAGTALTVDAVRDTPGARTAGAFLGGAIALGPGSLARALEAAGARLPAFELDPDTDALGRSTDGALRSGVVVGFRGAVRELCRAISIDAHGSLEGVTAYLTGGARDYARSAVRELFGDRTVEDPLLVHRGLAAAARDGAR